MRGGVAFCVAEEGLIVRDHLIEVGEYVVNDIGVGVFVNCYGGGGVGDEDCGEA